MSDSRREGRLNMVFSVYISGSFGTSLGIARNISEGGMFIETRDPYPLGEQIQITFSVPGHLVEMTAIGEVVHVCFVQRTAAGAARTAISGMGVRFLGFVQPAQEGFSPQPALVQ